MTKKTTQIWHYLFTATKLNDERILTAFPPMRGTRMVGIITAVPKQRMKCWKPRKIAPTAPSSRRRFIYHKDTTQ